MPEKAESRFDTESRSDSTLMLAYRTGDVQAFEIIYKRYKDGLFAYFMRNTNDNARSRELFQDVWMSVIQGREKYQETAPFSSWLYRIAHNRLVDHYRYLSSRTEDEQFNHEIVSSISSPMQPQEILAVSEDRQRLDKAVQKLPVAQRNVFVMRMELRLGMGEIAEITGVERETVKSRLRYACNKMRTFLRSVQ